MKSSKPRFHLLVFLFFLAGCANITSPTGGKKDTIPPKLVSANPADSLLNTRVKRLELNFDEYITVNDATREVQISPILAIQPTVTGLYRKVIVKIADTLLDSNTTYRISFGNSIKDLHENNIFKNYTYTFSTGAYFDSLELKGKVLNAATGLPDTGGVIVVLYAGKDNDSAIVRHKPKYITTPDASGNFTFKGLPQKSFKIYAIKDPNTNLIYDGPGESIAFLDHNVTSGDTSQPPILLQLFSEPDTTTKVSGTDSVGFGKKAAKVNAKEGFSYNINVDTSNRTKRSFDIKKLGKNNPVTLSFNRLPTIFNEKMTMSYDSEGVKKSADIVINLDTTAHKKNVNITTSWLENTEYTLRLSKGFAKDTGGTEAHPGKYVFRTFEEEDYGKIAMHLPGKYNNPVYVLQVSTDKDTVYQQPVTDSIVSFTWLRPTKYTFRLIVDKNRNGQWDAGSLFEKIQPEVVIPYKNGVSLKAGWDNNIDFEVPETVKGPAKKN